MTRVGDNLVTSNTETSGVLINRLRRNYTSICIKDCLSLHIIRMDTVPTKHQKAPAPKRPVHVAVVVALAPTAVDPIDPANQAGVDGMDAFFSHFVFDVFSGP